MISESWPDSQWNLNALPVWECVKPQWLESDWMYSSDCLQVLITFTNEVFLSFTESSSILGWILHFKETFTEVLLLNFHCYQPPLSHAVSAVLASCFVLLTNTKDAEQTAREDSAGRLATDELWNSPPFRKKVQAGTEVLPSMTDWFFSYRLVKQRFCVFPELHTPMPWCNLTVPELWLEISVPKIQEHKAPCRPPPPSATLTLPVSQSVNNCFLKCKLSKRLSQVMGGYKSTSYLSEHTLRATWIKHLYS